MKEFFTAFVNGLTDPVEWIGYVGALLFLVSYNLVSKGKIKGDKGTYNILVLFGALVFFTYSLLSIAPAITFVNAFFIRASVKALWRCYNEHKNAKTNKP
jgi:hypothetical protein